MFIKIYLCTVMLSFLSFETKNFDNTNYKRITVVGIALQNKIGAVLKTDKGYYVVDGLDEWGEKYYEKKVEVTGRLVVKVLESKSSFPGEMQEITGKLAILKKPKWRLAE
jgi:hypothetical protein